MAGLRKEIMKKKRERKPRKIYERQKERKHIERIEESPTKANNVEKKKKTEIK